MAAIEYEDCAELFQIVNPEPQIFDFMYYNCTHAWHLACMHALYVHMFVGVCACMHVHVYACSCICMFLWLASIKIFLKLKLIHYFIASLSRKPRSQ